MVRKDFKPNYIDRHMSSDGQFGDIGSIKVTNEHVVFQPDSAAPKMMIIFACVFSLAFIYLTWRFNEGPNQWLTLVVAPLCGGIAFGFIYWITKKMSMLDPTLPLIELQELFQFQDLTASFRGLTLSASSLSRGDQKHCRTCKQI